MKTIYDIIISPVMTEAAYDRFENKTYTFNRNKNWRPRSKDSALFNTGDDSLYAAHFPEDLAQFANLDFAGGERVLEGRIDVGAGEMIYDPTGTQIILR